MGCFSELNNNFPWIEFPNFTCKNVGQARAQHNTHKNWINIHHCQFCVSTLLTDRDRSVDNFYFLLNFVKSEHYYYYQVFSSQCKSIKHSKHCCLCLCQPSSICIEMVIYCSVVSSPPHNISVCLDLKLFMSSTIHSKATRNVSAHCLRRSRQIPLALQ